LDDLYAAGANFTGTKLEHHANCMKRTSDMIKLIDVAVQIIRENNCEGELFYWILYCTYFSPQKFGSVDETVDRIQMHIPHISRDIYYRQRKRAVKTFSSVLWGFTTKSEIDTLDVFV
jgi:hypothetical protein